MFNSDYLEKFNNLVDPSSAFNSQLYYQSIVDTVTEEKYPGGSYKILDLDKKKIIQQTDK